ncbi:MAG TPA: DUF485 domain-containing protein [Gammaproteobacteria bacterium]
MQTPSVDWSRLDSDPRFQALHRKKTVFLWGLMIFSVIYYFLLPVGAAYFQELFSTRVWGPVNIGILFALSEFLVAWTVAFVYSYRANTQFDAMAQEILASTTKGGR